MNTSRFVIVCILFSCLILIGCSGRGEDPISPGNPDPPGTTLNTIKVSDRILWGIWEIGFNSDTCEIVVHPDRQALEHYDVTKNILPPLCDDCFVVKLNSFDPDNHFIDVDVILKNPFQQAGYDVRGILFTNDFGLKLLNEDNWTGLWDIPGGDAINPFKAFAKDETKRIFIPDAEHVENYVIYIPDTVSVKFAVDASNPSNCEEPYEIAYISQKQIFDIVGSTGDFKCRVRDWQYSVSEVVLVAPEITGEDLTQLENYSSNSGWRLDLTNNTGAPEGIYRCRLYAKSSNSGSLALYQYVDIIISHLPDPIYPVDVTPHSLNFTPEDVAIDGNYAYAACRGHGLHIFDISDISNPTWVNSVPTPQKTKYIAAKDGNAYVASDVLGFYIIDVDPPESAYIKQSFDIGGELAMQGNFVYVRGYGSITLDISDPENIVVINSSPFGGTWGYALGTSENYMYYSYGWWDMGSDTPMYAMSICDISDPYDIDYVGGGPFSYNYACNNGYAYLSNGSEMNVYKILSTGLLHFLYTLDLSFGSYSDIAFSDLYVYLTDYDDGLHVYEFDPEPVLTYVGSLELKGMSHAVDVSGEIACVANYSLGLQVIDLSIPDSPQFAGSAEGIGVIKEVVAENGYAYAACPYRFRVVDVTEPESAVLVRNVEIQGNGIDLALDGGYAYIITNGLNNNDHFIIIDISEPQTSYIVNDIELDSWVVGESSGGLIDVADGYAYIIDSHAGGVCVYDVDPPESAYEVAILVTDSGRHCNVQGDYTYISGGDELVIYNISDPESAYLEKTLKYEPGKLQQNMVSNGYAFAGMWNSRLVVFDIDPLESAQFVIDISLNEYGGYVFGMAITDQHCFIAQGNDSVTVVDISNPEIPVAFQSIETTGWARDVDVSEGYLYVAQIGMDGLGIFQIN